jgi:hypothetical protein
MPVMTDSAIGRGKNLQGQFLQQIDKEKADAHEELGEWIFHTPLGLIHKTLVVFTE